MPAKPTVDPKILDKIRKLKAKAENTDFEGEGQVFMEKVQELMLKHNLDLAAIETSGEGSVKGDVQQGGGLETNRRSEWEGRLLSTISYYNLCKAYAITSRETKTKTWYVVGRPHNVEFVQELHEFVVEQLKRACKLALHEARGTEGVRNPNSFRRSFFEGAELAVGARLAEQQRARMRHAGPTSQELVRSETADIEKFLDALFGGNMKTMRPRGSRNWAGRNAGATAGRNTDLFPGRKLGDGS